MPNIWLTFYEWRKIIAANATISSYLHLDEPRFQALMWKKVPLLKAIVIRMHLLHLGLQCESR